MADQRDPARKPEYRDGRFVKQGSVRNAPLASAPGPQVADGDTGLRTNTEDTADRQGQIVEAIGSLSDADYTTDGKPKISAIDQTMPEGSEPVTAEERDAAWASMQNAG